ncbi:TolC family protein [Roseisolibacter sp. H3M3-2]|uniref:TolC family protein n=1 Tax=Roseisolibacter sp. H3M3-2 TaxID=3031323 RepID=UPI0023DADB8C|nr:TolC family protein [Roseisolibacter sp. H3M3-2]MDF1505206.1 TolC family protein [Roseisolibacter sp. H3M3-2]
MTAARRTSALALLLLAAPLAAQAPVAPLTLDDAVGRALGSGPSARAAQSSLDAARWRERSFFARLMPQLGFRGTLPSYRRAITPIVQPDGTIRYLGQRLTTSTAALTLSQPIALTGGTFFVESALERTDLSGDRGASRLWQSTPFTIGVEQRLFRPNTIAWNSREQDLQLDVAERSFVEAREQASEAAAGAYFDLYAAQMNLANAETNAAVNDSLFLLSKGRFEVGRIGENDLLQSELALLRARAAADEARLQRDRARSSLNLLLGAPPDAEVTVAPPAGAPSLTAPDPDRAVAEARRNAARNLELDLQEVRAERGLREARLNNGFGMTVRASYGYNQTAPLFGGAYESLLNQQTANVSVEVPVVQWRAGKAAVEAARADRQRTEVQTRVARLTLEQDARFAALGVAQAARQLALAAKADTVGEKRFEIAKNRYVIGRIAITDLFIAQSEKDAARAASIQALRAYWLAYYRLRRLTLYDFVTGQPLRAEG